MIIEAIPMPSGYGPKIIGLARRTEAQVTNFLPPWRISVSSRARIRQ
ncbi:MAG: hypothetical protein IT530_06650 [Burkholderiales bacterium]|nr:hypothetical protein [Burkholderiales bacterium]